MSIMYKGKIVEDEKNRKILIEGFERIYINYLNREQILSILKNIKMVQFFRKESSLLWNE